MMKIVALLIMVSACLAYPTDEVKTNPVPTVHLGPELVGPEQTAPVELKPVKSAPASPEPVGPVQPASLGTDLEIPVVPTPEEGPIAIPEKAGDDLKTDATHWWGWRRSYYPSYRTYHYPRSYSYYSYPTWSYRSYWYPWW